MYFCLFLLISAERPKLVLAVCGLAIGIMNRGSCKFRAPKGFVRISICLVTLANPDLFRLLYNYS